MSPRDFFHEKHIVLVDDEEISLNVSCYLLESLGADLTTFSDPLEAIEYCRKWHADIDILLLDVVMPMLSGLEFARQLRTLNLGLPIIGLSANNSDIDRQECLTHGMTALLTKPLRASDLVALLS
ncbi:MAG TPA: response regulator [Pseudomonadales bacterium]|nr:response regulator [Pseudomonadales bacterium]